MSYEKGLTVMGQWGLLPALGAYMASSGAFRKVFVLAFLRPDLLATLLALAFCWRGGKEREREGERSLVHRVRNKL